MSPPIRYSGLSFDRAHLTRRDGDAAALAADPAARFCLYWRGMQLIDGEPPVACWASGAAAQRLLELSAAGACVLLGIDEAGPLFALDLSAIKAESGGPDLSASLDLSATLGCRWALLTQVGGQLSATDAAALAYARGILGWRERTRYCSVCGTKLEFIEAGHSGRCSSAACGAQHFPRTDPAVIALVTDPDGRALLGRQPSWAPGMYSCLAGFVEPGETLEEAVAREVWEEAGIRVTGATFFANQPWPFPSSLMIGFTATAEAGNPAPDHHELEDARWFTRADMAQFGEAASPGPNGLFLPRPTSISRLLIEAWRKG
jgi:NAD+ diphosphatase